MDMFPNKGTGGVNINAIGQLHQALNNPYSIPDNLSLQCRQVLQSLNNNNFHATLKTDITDIMSLSGNATERERTFVFNWLLRMKSDQGKPVNTRTECLKILAELSEAGKLNNINASVLGLSSWKGLSFTGLTGTISPGRGIMSFEQFAAMHNN